MTPGPPPSDSPGTARLSSRRSLRALPGAVRVLLVRLRFVLMLLAILAVIASWDLLRSHWDRLTRNVQRPSEAVSLDTEYWCPMCPGIVSSWPGKCPVCNMALLRRKKGEMVPLPDGVLTRMQFSPYRLQLAGVRTTPVEYQSLYREVLLAGFVEPRTQPARACVQAEVSEQDLPFLEPGQPITAATDLLPGHSPFEGKITRVGPYVPTSDRLLRVCVELEDYEHELRPSMLLTLKVAIPATQRPWSRRAIGEDWRDRLTLELIAPALACPPGSIQPTGVQTLLRMAAAQAMLHADRVLALPESAVVDTGSRKVVYVESAPGVFDGREVQLGPRCGSFYPVLHGLEAGERAASAGAFLIDAETRLSLGAAAAYFGAAARAPAAGTPTHSRSVPSKGLSAEDQALADLQMTCPVTGEPLDSMGGPVRVEVNGRIVFLCCKGCEAELRKNAAKYLSQLPAAPGK